jgi:hypothetical protein
MFFAIVAKRAMRTRCFAALFTYDQEKVRLVAEMGDAVAQAQMAGFTQGEERFLWAKKSAAQGERDGFFFLGACYRNGTGCAVDLERADENYALAWTGSSNVESLIWLFKFRSATVSVDGKTWCIAKICIYFLAKYEHGNR